MRKKADDNTNKNLKCGKEVDEKEIQWFVRQKLYPMMTLMMYSK